MTNNLEYKSYAEDLENFEARYGEDESALEEGLVKQAGSEEEARRLMNILNQDYFDELKGQGVKPEDITMEHMYEVFAKDDFDTGKLSVEEYADDPTDYDTAIKNRVLEYIDERELRESETQSAQANPFSAS